MTKRLFLLCLLASLGACDYLPSWMGGDPNEKPKLPGERLAVLPVEEGLLPDAALASLAIALPAPYENAAWAQHTGAVTSASSNLAVSGTLDNERSGSIGEGEAFGHTLIPRPIVAGGMVFAMDAIGSISAHQAGDVSQVIWQSRGLAEEDDPDTLGGGLSYYEGRVYALSGRGQIGAFDATSGKELWRKYVGIPFRSAPRVIAGKLFAITIDNQTFAFNAANGEVAWSQRGIEETAGIMNAVSPAVDGDVVIAPYSSGELYALSATTGKELWTDSLIAVSQMNADNVFSGIGGDPVIDGEVVFAVSTSGNLSVYSMALGRRVWTKPVSSLNTPWITGDFLYVLSDDNHLLCIVKYSGAIRWATRLPSFEDEEGKRRPIYWKGPVMVSGKLAIVSSNGQLALVSATDGSLLETKSVPDDIYTAPVVAAGRMYLVSKNATLYSLQ